MVGEWEEMFALTGILSFTPANMNIFKFVGDGRITRDRKVAQSTDVSVALFTKFRYFFVSVSIFQQNMNLHIYIIFISLSVCLTHLIQHLIKDAFQFFFSP